MDQEEYFGNDDQRALLKRGHALAGILKNDTRFSFYGRTVGMASSQDGDLDLLAALARTQGNSNCAAVPEDESPEYASGLRARGLVPLIYRKWEGAGDTLAAARAVLDAVTMPGDVTVLRVVRETPGDLLSSAARMALECGVLPICGPALRAELQPAVCVMAVDRSNNVVSIAAASAFAHPNHATLSGQAWWGILATDPVRRGQKLALVLGAHAILEMEARFGFRNFMTGVEPGNAASEAVCATMALAPRGQAIVGCADAEALTGGLMTK